MPVLDHRNSGYVIYGTFDRYCRDDQWWPVQRKLFLFFFFLGGGGDPALADVRKKSIFIQSCPFTVSLKTILVCIYSVCEYEFQGYGGGIGGWGCLFCRRFCFTLPEEKYHHHHPSTPTPQTARGVTRYHGCFRTHSWTLYAETLNKSKVN